MLAEGSTCTFLATGRCESDDRGYPRLQLSSRTSAGDPGDSRVPLCHRKRLRLARSHPAKEVSQVMHPPDIGHQRNALPGSKVLNAELEVLPKCPTCHSVEIVHHNDESDFAACRSLIEGG